MLESLNPYLLAFIALFVAVDAIGNIPIFISLIEGTSKKQRNKIVGDSVSTATLLAIIFMFAGKVVLRFIGVTIPDFQIAGGALLFFIAVRLLLPSSSKGLMGESHDPDLGVFPLGTPLITGPAVLTTTLIMVDSYGIRAACAALLVNMAIVWITLAKAEILLKWIGPGGLRALSKIMYILLAAIGVMMVRRGIAAIVIGG
ncbi:MAG: MarC family protein [Candidatus Omnitrophota bacterium]